MVFGYFCFKVKCFEKKYLSGGQDGVEGAEDEEPPPSLLPQDNEDEEVTLPLPLLLLFEAAAAAVAAAAIAAAAAAAASVGVAPRFSPRARTFAAAACICCWSCDCCKSWEIFRSSLKPCRAFANYVRQNQSFEFS